MSDFIPMIPSSPPPLDDTRSFDDWEHGDDNNDDFGGFASANFPAKTSPTEKHGFSVSSDQETPEVNRTGCVVDSDSERSTFNKHDGNISDAMSHISPSADDDEFGHFATTDPSDDIGLFRDGATMETSLEVTDGAVQSFGTFQADCCSAQSQHYSQEEATLDSGICSKEISPVSKSDHDEHPEFARGDGNADQFKANGGSALSIDSLSVMARNVADSRFGSGAIITCAEGEVDTNSETADIPPDVPDCDHPSDCPTDAACDDILASSLSTYHDTSVSATSETSISETVPAHTNCNGGKISDELNRDICEHSNRLVHGECYDPNVAVATTLTPDMDCAFDNDADCVLDGQLQESSGEDNLSCSVEPTESSSLSFPASGNESESVLDLQAAIDNDDTLQETMPTSSDRVDEMMHSEMSTVELGSETNIAQLECFRSEGDGVNNSDDSSNAGAEALTEKKGEKDLASCSLQDDEDDDFSNFADPVNEKNKHTDGDDTFDAFSSFHDSGTPCVEEGDSDWAAFNSGGLTKTTDDESNDDWAAFHESDHETEAPPVGGDKEDEFGDFEEAEFGKFEEQKPPASVSDKPLPMDTRASMEAVLLQCFPPIHASIDIADVSLCLLIEIVTTEINRPFPSSAATGRHKAGPTGAVDVNVWNHLKDIEETPALKYTWTSSATSRRLLAAIAVDPRNMLIPHKKQSMPAFAADLGLLEPSRGGTKPATKSCDPIIVDTSRSTPPPTPVEPTPDIPPAEFDWNSSGLTNPLDARGCMPLDLDFLVITGNHGDRDVIVMQSEALQKEQEILEAIETLAPSGNLKTLQPLESILAGMKFVSTAPHSISTDSTNLTDVAVNVIGRLPDLSFMHASVLMFPVKGDQ